MLFLFFLKANYILADYKKLKPLLQKFNKLLHWAIAVGVCFTFPNFAFQTGLALTSSDVDQEAVDTILLTGMRYYLSLILLIGIPSEIHRHVRLLYSDTE